MSASTPDEWPEPIPLGKPAATITVRHDEASTELSAMTGQSWRSGIDVEAEITYQVGQTEAALIAVNRLAESLRRQIADAAESSPR